MATSLAKITAIYRSFFPGLDVPKIKPITTMKAMLERHGIISTDKQYKVLKDLPEFIEVSDVIANILTFLEYYELNKVKYVNKQWYAVLQTPSFWRQYLSRQIGEDYGMPPSGYRKACHVICSYMPDISSLGECITEGWFDLFRYVWDSNIRYSMTPYIINHIADLLGLFVGVKDSSYLSYAIQKINTQLPRRIVRKMIGGLSSSLWDVETQHEKLQVILESTFQNPAGETMKLFRKSNHIVGLSRVCRHPKSLQLIESLVTTGIDYGLMARLAFSNGDEDLLAYLFVDSRRLNAGSYSDDAKGDVFIAAGKTIKSVELIFKYLSPISPRAVKSFLRCYRSNDIYKYLLSKINDIDGDMVRGTYYSDIERLDALLERFAQLGVERPLSNIPYSPYRPGCLEFIKKVIGAGGCVTRIHCKCIVRDIEIVRLLIANGYVFPASVMDTAIKHDAMDVYKHCIDRPKYKPHYCDIVRDALKCGSVNVFIEASAHLKAEQIATFVPELNALNSENKSKVVNVLLERRCLEDKVVNDMFFHSFAKGEYDIVGILLPHLKITDAQKAILGKLQGEK